MVPATNQCYGMPVLYEWNNKAMIVHSAIVVVYTSGTVAYGLECDNAAVINLTLCNHVCRVIMIHEKQKKYYESHSDPTRIESDILKSAELWIDGE